MNSSSKNSLNYRFFGVKLKISIITVCFNSVRHIRDAIESVLNQTYPNIEYIVIDGKSTDGTADLIRKYEPSFNGRLKWVSESDKGIYDALNKGINMASGEVIGLLHSDDIFASNNTIANIASTFASGGNKKQDVDCVYGNLDYVDIKNPQRIIRHWKSQPFHSSLIKKGWMPPHPTLFARKKVYETQGLFDKTFSIAADYDLMLRVFKDCSLKCVYIPEVITKMRVGGISNRSIKNILQKSSEDFQVLRKNKVPFPLFVLLSKNVSKLKQFFYLGGR